LGQLELIEINLLIKLSTSWPEYHRESDVPIEGAGSKRIPLNFAGIDSESKQKILQEMAETLENET
jgi:hypothetical protein